MLPQKEQQAGFLLSQFMNQNLEFFKKDSLLCNWMRLLETSVPFDSADDSLLDANDSMMSEPIDDTSEDFSDFLAEVFSENETDQSQQNVGFLPDRRDLYLSLLNN